MFRIIIQWANNKKEITIEEGDCIVIGRLKEKADVVIPDDCVSSQHCELSVRNNRLYVKDLSSTNGTFINGHKIHPGEYYLVAPANTLSLASPTHIRMEIITSRPSDEERIRETRTIHIEKDITTIGRDEDNDIVIPLPIISRHHARIIREGDRLYIEDLNSTNGTFVNGEKISGRVLLQPGAKISLGSYILNFERGRQLTGSSFSATLELKCIGSSFKIKDKCLVKNIHFAAKGGELIGIIGPAGCGKTTFLNILAGLLPESEGTVILNGEDLYENYDSLSVNIGYVPQDDIVHRELTVYQSLYYTAWLRLPSDTSPAEREEVVKRVIDELELKDAQNVIIGYPEKKGISGGQRKKVNMAQEWITKPSILFLDEPGTGLDPEGQEEVVKLLRKFADTGKIVVMVTHGIKNEEDARLFDKILIIAKGIQVYYGPPDGLFKFFGKKSISEIFGELKQIEKIENWHKKFIESDYYRELKNKISGIHRKEGYQNFVNVKKRVSLLSQFNALVSRYIKRKISDRMQTLFLILQAPVIGFIISQLFKRIDNAVLLLLVMSGIWFGLINSMREIVAERAIYRRERRANVKIIPYIGSKLYVLGSLALFQTIMLLLVSSIGVNGIWQKFPLLTGIIFLASIVSVAMGLMISSVVNTQETVVALIPIVVIVELIFCGGIKPISQFSRLFRNIAEIIPSKWAMEGVINIIGGVPSPLNPDVLSSASSVGFRSNLFSDFVFLICFFVFFTVLTMIFLKMKER